MIDRDFQTLVVTPKISKKTMDTVMDNKPLCKSAPMFQLLPGFSLNVDKRNTGELIVPSLPRKGEVSSPMFLLHR